VENVNDEDGVIRDITEKMTMKFDKYRDEYSVDFALGAILNPKMKLETLRFYCEKVYPICW